MKKSLIIALALFLGVFLVNSTATQVTRFGPKQYVSEKGKPQTVTDTFPAEAGVGTLIVENGDADHHHQVSHVKITLNGKMVFGPWVFDRHGKHNKHRVHLVENNTLSVQVDGKPGSYITVTIIQDVKPPSTAVEVTRFGPKQYVSEKGKPQTTTDTFTAYAGAGKIIVVNGEGHQHHQGRDEDRDQRDRDEDAEHGGWDEDANHRVSSAIITLNGKEVLGPRDFKRHRSHLEADVDLLVNNTLSVKLLGRPGSYLTITVIQAVTPPTASITASPDAIILGSAATLTWTSTNADKVSIDPGIGAVDPTGSRAVTPQESTTYTITATNDGGTATASTQVTVYIPPTVTLSVDPASIILGNTATLTWVSTNAETATIDQGIGSVPTDGSITVTPSQTTTYTITVTGPGGQAQATAQVVVYIPPTVVTISVNPQTIQVGQSATLSWSSTNAERATIDQGIGAVPQSGSRTIKPNQTTTYTINVQGPGGTAQASATITVTSPYPFVEISAEPAIIAKGGSAILSWTSLNAQSAAIDNGVGTVPLTGSVTVSPVATTTYTITVSGPLGVANAQATVAVQAPVEPQPEGSFGEQYQDLIPADSSAGTYDAKRFSVVTGLVHDQGGAPIAGVAVTMLGHPEYGTAFTDGAGRYSLPVEGGSVMTVTCEQQGLITAHRKVNVPWNDIAIVETMVMIPYDQKATTVTFDGNPNTVITHQSTPVNDQWGTRSATTVFTGDNQAYLVDNNGNTLQQLTTITTRATEFTTPDSMPAKLPPNSAYTYCVDLTVDGAERVKFAKPVVTWVENFLGFPVGEPVPVGYYDTVRGLWVPSDSGRVVRLLDTNSDGIVDAYDDVGDGQPHGGVTGLNDPAIYKPGATFWRFAVPHFYSKWDANWAWSFGPGTAAIFPNATGGASGDKTKEVKPCVTYNNSSIEDRNRIFHEDIPIPGTDLTLHYASNRVEGYKNSITVPASGSTVPSSLKRIIVKVEVAGRVLEQILTPLPDQKAEFEWDGLDQLGRPVMNPTTAHVEIGFVYDGVYQRTTRFGYNGGGMITGSRTREEVTLWRRDDLTVYPASSMIKGEGGIGEGWTLSAHHYLSPMDPSTLHKGDGTTIQNNAIIINTVAGTGVYGYSGDGGPATLAKISNAYGVALDAQGNFYFGDHGNSRIRKVDTNGIITTIAGNGTSGYSGDGGPAIQAQVSAPWGVAVDAAGNLYIVDGGCIRKVDTNGIITTVAGVGTTDGYSGDGGPATQALLNFPQDVAIDAQGNLYIADSNNLRIRKVDTNGIITTVAGGRYSGPLGDGGPATNAYLYKPSAVAADTQGNIYIVVTEQSRIRKVDTKGIITTVAGNGTQGFSGDGGPATQARLDTPLKVAVDSQGNLYIAERYTHRIRKVDANGIITTIAGSGPTGYYAHAGFFSGDGGPPTESRLNEPRGVAVDPRGNLYIADSVNGRVRKVGPPAAFENFMTGDDIPFADENGLGYIMASSGRHKQTFDLDTGVVLYEFGYDENKNLVTITDRFGNQTTITRDGNGVPRSITSPDGITTSLAIDGNNHLTSITYPDGGRYGFEYTSEGLMTAKIEPEGNRFEHTFSSTGRLTAALDEQGGHWQYAREAYPNGDIQTEVLTAEGDLTTYLDHEYSTGAYTSTITDPTGAQTTYARSADGLAVNKNLSCGMKLAFKYGVDPEYKYQVVTGMWEDTPAGLERITQMNKTYQDTNSDKVPDRITETVAVNGKATTLVTNTPAATKTLTSPVGRTVTTYYDPNTLLTSKLTIPGLYETTYGYDAKGRLTTIKTNARQTDFTYTPQGFLESIIDPENHTTWYAYDAVGRMTGIARPDGSSIGFAYDTNGNMVVLATPTDVKHLFGYNKVDLNNVYQAPISGQYQYYYDRDRRLTRIHFPSGMQINNIYSNGRLNQIQTPEGNINFTYLCGSKVGSVAMTGEGITYGYDGSLVTSESMTGTLNQTLGYTYNADFNLTGFTYAGGTTSYTYDNDGLLTKAGAFTITRNAQNGLPTAVTGGTLNLSRTFNGYGEVDGEGFTIGGSNLTSWALTRDKAGRIIQKQETVNGTTANYVYSYDAMGRLLTVTKDGALVEQYQYNQNGTRISEVNTLRGITGRSFTYSDEDHLLDAGGIQYQYDADGFLLTKTNGTEKTEYSYSSRGELIQVKLPDGRVINHIHDPLGRRIAKVVNGSIVEKYLWKGLTQLLAVYDGSSNLLMRFDYANGRMPVSMTQGGSTYYLTYDQIGTLKVVSDAAGNVVKRIDYDSFGNIIGDTNPSFTVPFGFAGGLHDRDTGLVRFGYRDYDSDIGRWTAKDPKMFNGNETDLYGYCLNNPVNFFDAKGLDTCTDDLETCTKQALKRENEFLETILKTSVTIGTSCVFSLVLGPEVAGPCLGATIVATEVALEVSHIVLAIELDKCGSDYKKCVEEESKKEKEACNK
jgi:RHS repeat-associated protein